MSLSSFHRLALISGVALTASGLTLSAAHAQTAFAVAHSLVSTSKTIKLAATSIGVPREQTISGLRAIIAHKKALAATLPKVSKEEIREKLEEMQRAGVARLRSHLKAHGESDKAAANDDDEGGLAATQAEAARLYRLMQRTNNRDSLDQSVIQRAIQQRDAMRSAGNANGGGAQANGIAAGGGRPGALSVNPLLAGPPANPISAGAQWQLVGPQNGVFESGNGVTGPCTGRVNAITYDARVPGTAYCGGAKGGVWKTTNYGTTWTPLTDNQPTLAISSIAVDPTNSNIIYAGTGDYDGGDGAAIGILKSTDAGATWAVVGNSSRLGGAIHKILINPVTPTTLYATAGNNGLYKSVNSGLTWQHVNIQFQYPEVPATSPFYNLVGSVSNVIWNSNRSEMIVCSDASGPNPGEIVDSFDGGATWHLLLGVSAAPLLTGGRFDIAASQTDPGTLYAIDGAAKMIYKRANGVWTALSGFPGDASWSQSFYDIYISTGEADRVFVGLINMYFSLDGGTTWVKSMDGHPDQHAFASVNRTQYLLGNDGGSWLGTIIDNGGNAGGFNATSQVLSLNQNLYLTQFYFGAYNPSNSNGFLGGSQDNGSPQTNDMQTWIDQSSGDGGGCAINQDAPGTQYVSVYNLANLGPTYPTIYPVYRTDDAWNNTFTDISVNTLDTNAPFLALIRTNLANPNLVYLATNYLFQYNATANTWSELPPRLSTNGYVLSIGSSTQDQNTLYTGTTDGTVFYSTTGGQTYTNITANLPGGPVTSLFVSPTNSKKIYATVSNSGIPHVWRCDNTSASTPVWVNISGQNANTTLNLPDIATLSLGMVPGTNEQQLYVGTDIGVFSTTDGGQTWANATAPLGLPNAEVDDVTVVPGTGYLMGTTYGRSMWRLPVTIPTATLTLAPTLQSYRGSKSKLRVTVTGSFGTRSGYLTGAGTFPMNIPAGVTYNFTVSIAGFLKKHYSGVYVGGNMTLGNTVFYAGDVNGDNVIDATDLALVRASLNQYVTGPVDVDGDGRVTSTDVSIVQGNLGRRGDN